MDALDERADLLFVGQAILVLVHGEHGSEFLHAFHGGEPAEGGLPPQGLGRVFGHRQGEPGALVGLGQQLVLQLDALQPDRLQVQQVVVVPQFAHADGQHGGQHQGRRQRQPGLAVERAQAGVDVQGGRHLAAEGRRVEEHDHGRQHGHGRQPAEEDAAAGDDCPIGRCRGNRSTRWRKRNRPP